MYFGGFRVVEEESWEQGEEAVIRMQYSMSLSIQENQYQALLPTLQIPKEYQKP